MATQNLILAQNIFVSIWNLNTLTAQNYLKVSQSQAFKLVYKLYITSISETHLDSLISKDDNVLSTEGYSLIMADYLSNTKRGDVCISYSEKTSVTPINNIYVKSSLEKKKGFVFTLYRSPSQNQGEFEHFYVSL